MVSRTARHTVAMLLSSIGLTFYTGCVGPTDHEPAAASPPGATEDHAGDRDAGLLLRIEVEANHTVEFYEQVAGGLFLIERKSGAQQFALTGRERSDALAAFTRLRPGAAVPAALRSAYDRARDQRILTDAPQGEFDLGEPEAVSGVIEQALTSSAAASNFVNEDGGCAWGPTRSICRVNRTGNRNISWNADSGECQVDHYAGNGLTIQISIGGVLFSTTFQAADTHVMYGLGIPGAVTNRRIDILNAGAGDAFHYGCRWGS